MTAPKDDLKAFTARFPAVLYITVQNDVAKRKANGNPKFSMQEWLLEAVREKLYPDLGPEQRNPVEKSAPYFPEKSGSENSAPLMAEYSAGGLRKVSRPTAAELAAKLGIKTGATIEEVEPRMNPESGYISPNAAASSVDDDCRREFVAEFGRQVWDRAIRIPAFKKAKWPERLEMAREQKERGE